MKQLVHEVLFDTGELLAKNIALICDKQSTTYGSLLMEIQRLSGLLRDGGLERGQRVAVLSADKKKFLVSCYAVMSAGGVAVPLHSGCSAETVQEIVRDCEPRFLVAGAEDIEAFGDIGNFLKTGFIILRKRHGGKDDSYIVSHENIVFESKRDDLLSVDPDDGAMILYTSGTSGKRKGVFLTHRNLTQATLNINQFMGVDGSLKEFVSIPLSHSFGFGRARCIFLAGGTMVCSNGMLTPTAMNKAIVENDCNAFSAVPAVVAMFFGRFEHLLLQLGPRIRFVELGSSSMPLDHKLNLLNMLPNAKICMHYGLTEASRSAFLEFRQDRGRLHTVGKASPNVEIAVLNPLGVPQTAGDSGEIAIRGPHVSSQYWNNPSLTALRISKDGWLRTGDFGSIHENGYLQLIGRNDEMINMGGIKISPQEIEDPIRNLYPSVDLCVVGCPDPKGIAGEIPVLCYVPQRTKIKEGELMRLLGSRLDRFKIPRFTVQVNELPKTQNQKLRRQEVRKLVSEHIAEMIKREGKL